MEVPPRFCMPILAVLALAPLSAGQVVERISIGSGGGEANDYSWHCAVSADGTQIAFQSNADNLGAADTNGVHDVYLRDLGKQTTELISVGLNGQAANGISDFPEISADGNRVVFYATASNLVSGDLNAVADIFVRDRATQTTTRVSVGVGGAESNGVSYSPTISGDGRWLAFVSAANNLVATDVNGLPDIFVHDFQNGQTYLASTNAAQVTANGASFTPALSHNGRYLTFRTAANNLVSGDVNGQHDIVWRDLWTGETEIVSLTDSGTAANHRSDYPTISADGQRIAFRSSATNLIANDQNQVADIFVRDRVGATTRRVSARTAAGAGMGGSGSTGAGANGLSFDPAISADGRFVVYRSEASNLVRGDSNGIYDVFCHDLKTGITERLSVGDRHQQANGESWYPSINADGSLIAFKCYATNFGVPDSNQHSDIYLRRRQAVYGAQ